jgi:cytochrome c556
MRSALLIVLGLVIGILGSVFTFSALHQRTPLPKAVMTVMAYHSSVLHHAVKSNQCDAAAIAANLARLQSTALDVPAAFKGVEQPFLDASDKLQGAVGSAVTAAPTSCAALASALQPVDDACDSCHKRFR